MKKFVLVSLVLGVFAVPASATSVFEDGATYTVAENTEVRTKTIQHKFASKRALNTRRFSEAANKQSYDEDAAWVGATQRLEDENNHGKRLNKLFKSRRGYRQ